MIDKTSKQIAEKLKQVRLQKGLTQVELANKAGINDNYYAKVERGELKPSVETLEKIIKALGVRSSAIFPF
jgi:transcriptional regulator with XRE-family HTH domain